MSKEASRQGLEADVMPRGGGEEGFLPEGLERCVRAANPLNDALFKYLFARPGNEANLLRLLNDLLGPDRGIVS